MRKILVSFFSSHLNPTVIHCDNQSCIKLSINLVFHDRSKHIDIRYHHIKDCVQRKIMLLQYIPTEDQDADILTKGSPGANSNTIEAGSRRRIIPILLRGSVEIQQDDELSEKSRLH